MIALFMRHLARLPINYPKTVILVSILLTFGAGVFLPRLHVSTDRNLLSGTENEAFKRREEVDAMFGTALSVVVIVSAPTSDEVRDLADDVATRLASHEEYVREVFHRADIEFFERHGLMFASPETVGTIAKVVTDNEEDIEQIGDLESLPQIITLGVARMEEEEVPENTNAEEVDRGFEMAEKILDDLADWFEEGGDEKFGLIDRLWEGSPSLQGGAGTHGYLMDNDGESPRLAVLFVQPAEATQSMDFVEPLTDTIRAEVAAAVAEVDGAEGIVTGMPALQTDELRLVTRDCLVAGVFAGIGVIIVFIFAFRSVRVSVFLLFPLGVGLIWAAGFTGMLYGHLTMITSYFAAVLFGLGVPFTIHIVARFHEALRAGMDKRTAVETSLTRAGPGVVVGGVTTSVAFLAMAFSDFKGFAEMGIISGIGVLLILAANLTTLPAALLLWHPGESAVTIKKPSNAIWVYFARSRIVIPIISGLLLLAGAALAYFNEFDYAVENMLPEDSEAVKGMRLLDERTNLSTTYSVAVASTREEAEEKRRKLEALPSVSEAEAITLYVPGQQDEKTRILSEIPDDKKRVVNQASGKITSRLDHLGVSTARELGDSIQELADMLQDLAFDAKKTSRREAPLLNSLSKKASRVAKVIGDSGNDRKARELERQVFEALNRGLKVLAAGLEDKGFDVGDLPAAMRGRYVSVDGAHFAVIAYPNGDLNDKDFFYGHVDELESVDPEITGHPVTNKVFTIMVHEGFAQAIVLATVAVLLLVLLDLRSFRGLVLALVPVLVAMAWTQLVMYLVGLKYNYANLMALPILIGTGVDYGAHLAHRAKQEGCVAEAARTTGKAIALSGLTTLIGFGSLILGNHWGVRSLGLLLVIGISFSLVAALVVLPGMLRAREEREQTGDREGA